MDFRTHRVADLAEDVRSRQRSARELTEAALDRIQDLDDRFNAFVCVDEGAALRAADDVDRRLVGGEGVGPLAGIPVAVKDLEDAAGLPTRFGSKLSDAAPVEGDSVLVARLRAAGCVIVGKTTTPEYGHKGVTESGLTGITRNPWNPERSPGGSSGGSAVALASGMVPLATGSDGGGSIRIPAALCGFSAIKTTQGRIPLGGPTPPGSSLCAVKGPMALTVADTALALDMCVGPHPTDPFSLPRSGSPWYEAATTPQLPTRVAWSPTMGFADVDAEIRRVSDEAIAALEGVGVEVVLVDDIWTEDPVGPWYAFWTALRARTHGHLVGTDEWELIDPSLREQVERGLSVGGVEIVRALDAIHQLNLDLDAVFEDVPIILTPTCAGQTPVVGHPGTIDGEERPGWISFTYGLNLTRNPAGNVRCGFTADGMPVGLQVIGRQLGDVGVIQTMAAFEEVFGLSPIASIA